MQLQAPLTVVILSELLTREQFQSQDKPVLFQLYGLLQTQFPPTWPAPFVLLIFEQFSTHYFVATFQSYGTLHTHISMFPGTEELVLKDTVQS